MSEKKVSEILFILRTEKGISQELLCRGLCTKGAYSKYESGERRIDRLLLNAFLQRLGKNADKISSIMTPEEYRYFCWKKEILVALARQDMKAAEELLKRPEAVSIIVNEKLQQQFVYRVQVILSACMESGAKERIGLLTDAIAMTIPQIEFARLDQYLISVEEMEILLDLAGVLTQEEQQTKARERGCTGEEPVKQVSAIWKRRGATMRAPRTHLQGLR